MDIDEWEFLSDDAFLDFNDKDDSQKITDPSRNATLPNQLVPVPIQLEPIIEKTPNDDGLVKETLIADQDTVSQVFFKIKENEFVDMKMDSPKSGSRGFLPPNDAGTLKFEEKNEALEKMSTSPRMKVEKEMLVTKEEEDSSTWEENNSGFNLWKWSLTGVGAICSFGIAAATICVLLFGTKQRNKLHQDQKIRFQIYTDDKRIKQVVQHATRLNEAISAVRGVPLSRAHITCGGYYDGL